MDGSLQMNKSNPSLKSFVILKIHKSENILKDLRTEICGI